MVDVEAIRELDDEAFDALRLAVVAEEKRRRHRRAREAVKHARALLAAQGLDVQVVKKTEKPPPVRRDIPPGLYRDPESGAEWRSPSKGRPPRWLRDLCDAGEDVTRLRVKE